MPTYRVWTKKTIDVFVDVTSPDEESAKLMAKQIVKDQQHLPPPVQVPQVEIDYVQLLPDETDHEEVDHSENP